MSLMFVPIAVTATMMATAIRATMIPYSTAVAPSSESAVLAWQMQ